jgi:hypothetical protein
VATVDGVTLETGRVERSHGSRLAASNAAASGHAARTGTGAPRVPASRVTGEAEVGAPEPQQESLPADLVHLLILRAGLPEDQVAEMSREDAVARIQQFWSEGH